MQQIFLASKSLHVKVMSESTMLEGQEVADAKTMKAFREGEYVLLLLLDLICTISKAHHTGGSGDCWHKGNEGIQGGGYVLLLLLDLICTISSLLFYAMIFLLMGKGIQGKPSDSSEILERLGNRERIEFTCLNSHPWAFAFSSWMPIFLQGCLWSDTCMASSHFFHALLSYNWQVQIVHVQGMHWLDTDPHCNDCYDQINGQSSMTHIYSCVCMPRWGHLRVTFFANSI